MSEYGILAEPGSLSTHSSSFEMGWSFTANEKIKVSGLRIKMPAAQTTTAHLWSSSGTLLKSVSITASAGIWVEGQFDTEIELTSGSTYIISCYNTASRYYESKTSFTFNPKISYIAGRYTSSKNAFPSSTENGRVYPLIDIVITSAINHKPSGSAIVATTGITATVVTSSISWTESKPDGTTLAVSVSTDGANYSAVTNGGALLTAGSVLDNATIYIKVEMATTDTTVTPTLSNLAISLQSTNDTYSIVLEMQPLERFESAAGNITVAYAGGSLMGEGGAVAAFTQTFTPSDLAYKGDQNDAEHINIASIAANGMLVKINYSGAYSNEHINIASITAVGTLTNVSDI
jgi:hypothetical protein